MTTYATLATCTQCRLSSVSPDDENESQRSANIAALLMDGWTTEPVVCPKCNAKIRGEVTPTIEPRIE